MTKVLHEIKLRNELCKFVFLISKDNIKYIFDSAVIKSNFE